MGLKCGIVGLPNVGKSTLFRSLTNAKAEVANYPFCTIDPNQGTVMVPDKRLNALAEIFKPQSIVPTVVEIVDIAGLVKGASEGEGLGNKFLANIREVDAICHVVRAFEDENVIHVNGKVDPIGDILTIDTELALKDLETVTSRWNKTKKLADHQKDAMSKIENEVLEKVKNILEEGHMLRRYNWSEEEEEVLRPLCLLTMKPILYVANIKDDQLPEGGPLTELIRDYAAKDGGKYMMISGKFEWELADLDENERQEYLQSVGLSEPGKYVLIREVYNLLGLETYFTAGEKEVRAWTIKHGTLAPQAAGVIHSDFERGFIAADVVNWEKLVETGSFVDAKNKAFLRTEGKTYVVKDGDVCTFKFNV